MLPWLFDKVEAFVEELNVVGEFGDVFLGGNIDECVSMHKATVQAERDRKEAVKRSIEESAREKLEDKKRKKEAKEASKKAAELKKLREDVNATFVAKGEYKDSILSNEVQEITGFHLKNAGAVGALGGFLGQLALVVSGAHKKAKAQGIDLLKDAIVVQNFLFLYIDAKMRTEKFTLQVGKAMEVFLNTLEKPLQLNEMRVMKDSNYTRFRQILSDPSLFGDEILALMKEHGKTLGIS